MSENLLESYHNLILSEIGRCRKELANLQGSLDEKESHLRLLIQNRDAVTKLIEAKKEYHAEVNFWKEVL